VNGDATDYPTAYGSIWGWLQAANAYQYSYQLFKPSSGTSLYLRTASGASAWTAWLDLTSPSAVEGTSVGNSTAAPLRPAR
jgi:hypothetical protein